MKKLYLLLFTALIAATSGYAGMEVYDQHGNPLDASVTITVTIPEVVQPDPIDPVPDPDPVEPIPEPEPPTGQAWTEVITSTAFKAATPTREEINAFSAGGTNIWGVSGPYDDVLSAWNSVAFDAEGGCVYAHGGGHTNYGGNEVYRACIGGTWERLTDPSPYLGEEYPDLGPDCHAPITGPVSTHTYGGLMWHPVRKSVMLASSGAGFTQAGKCTEPSGDMTPQKYLAEFDPTLKTWTAYDRPFHPHMGFAVYADGRTYALSYYGQQLVIEDDLQMSFVDTRTKANEHTATYDSGRNVVWSIQGRNQRLYRWNVTPTRLAFAESITVPVEAGEEFGAAPGIAVRDGLVWIYGGRELLTFDPDTGVWSVVPSNSPAAGGRTYAKFHYWPSRDKFVYVTDKGAVWLLDPTKLQGETVDPTAKRAEINGVEYETIAAAVVASQDGDTITIYPGTYREGVRVDRNGITIKAHGVVIDGATYGGKAVFVQYGDDLTIEGIEAKNLAVGGENAALVRMEPSANNLTVRSVYVHDSQAGAAVTGNGTGDVVIEDSLVERTGYGGQAHGVYVGTGADRLIIRRSVFREAIRFGHLVKSRAPVTIIEDSIIDGAESIGSRVIDAPCGGLVEVRRTLLRQSPASDNKDLIAIAVEDCQLPESILVFDNVQVIATRPDARLLTTHQTVHIGCIGSNSFEGIASPCEGI